MTDAVNSLPLLTAQSNWPQQTYSQGQNVPSQPFLLTGFQFVPGLWDREKLTGPVRRTLKDTQMRALNHHTKCTPGGADGKFPGWTEQRTCYLQADCRLDTEATSVTRTLGRTGTWTNCCQSMLAHNPEHVSCFLQAGLLVPVDGPPECRSQLTHLDPSATSCMS